jgi:secreted PhoX family phosphatase
MPASLNRRAFLHHTAAAFSGLAAARAVGGDRTAARAGYGELVPIKDETTGLPLLKLPAGFRYLTMSWTGQPLSDGRKTPGAHDGMAVVKSDGPLVTIIRNHEVGGDGTPIGDKAKSYDPRGRGGCTNLVFDCDQGKLIKSWVGISGTSRNCAGGPTPWGTWLTCEETTDGPPLPKDIKPGAPKGFERDHGYIFEVSADEPAAAVPLVAMGRFNHEAVAVDPATGCVYETEDKNAAGFYRFTPKTPGKLAEGGKLEMLKVPGEPDLRHASRSGATRFRCTWVPIEEPNRVHSPGTTNGQGVFAQGKAQRATSFARLEGCWHGQGKIYFTATSGGKARAGQVWEYDPPTMMLRLVYESPTVKTLDYPDNLTVTPKGGILVCEDGGPHPKRLHGLTRDGRIFPFAENSVLLEDAIFGHKGKFQEQEWCGVTFSPCGRWMFANIQTPGITFAITGPWEEGALG